MDKRIGNISSTLDIPRLTKYDVYSKIIPEYNDTYKNIGHVDITVNEEFIEAAFCPLPPYCLVDDKEKYIRAANQH